MKIYKAIAFMAPFLLASSALAQISAPAPVKIDELMPIVVDNGRQEGDVVLSVDFGARGRIVNTVQLSGSEKLFATANNVMRLFDHKRLSGIVGVTQQVYFWKNKAGMKKTAPYYPPLARAAHMSGTVELIASVGVDGHVTDVEVVSGPPMLVSSAQDTVKQWIYPPIVRNGVGVPFHAVIDIDYL